MWLMYVRISRLTVVSREAKEEAASGRPTWLETHYTWVFYRNKSSKFRKRHNSGALIVTALIFQISKHSCESQLLTVTDDFAKALNNGFQIDVEILDFSKAFDKVPHRRLLAKVNSYGIKGNVLKWLESFLRSRYQQLFSWKYSRSGHSTLVYF